MQLPANPFVDTHVHFFDLDDPSGLRWSWLDATGGGSLHGDLAGVRARRFTPAELWAEGRRLAGLVKCVHVQSALGTDDPVLETRWLAGLRERYGAPHAAIAHVELERPHAEDIIDQHRQFDWVRGIRDPGKTGILLEPRYIEQVRRMGELGLIFEIFCSHTRFADLADLARRCPDTRIVLEHFGLAPPPSAGAFSVWQDRLRELGGCPNVHLKMSGLGMVDRGWTFADAGVLVEASLEAFGTQRCVLGTNWPIDRASSSYPDAVRSVDAATAELSDGERRALFCANAEELYGL